MTQEKILSKHKIIVILGPTASGKSDMAIKLAKKFNGEIISADSRQIYRQADLTTGKVKPDKFNKFYTGSKKYPALISQSIPHFLINIASLRTNYNAAKFQQDANYVINYIIKKGKLPIICGGTGFWIKALVDNVTFPEVKPDFELRKKLAKESAEKLFKMLQKIDAKRAATIDAQNKVRLIRAIEICKTIGKVPILSSSNEEGWDGKISPLHPTPSPAGRGWLEKPGKGVSQYDFLQIGISISQEKLRQNIQKRLEKRLGLGMIREVENLHQKYGISWKRLESLGLEFRWIARFLRGKINRTEMETKLYFDIIHYAKRQMTWFQRDKRISWLKNYSEIERAAKKFLL